MYTLISLFVVGEIRHMECSYVYALQNICHFRRRAVQIALKGTSRSRAPNALSFVCTPDDVKRKALCFRETLIVCLKSESARDSKPIGGYCILVESIGPQAHELLVHVQSSMFIDGHFGGSKVISSATSKFHCLYHFLPGDVSFCELHMTQFSTTLKFSRQPS